MRYRAMLCIRVAASFMAIIFSPSLDEEMTRYRQLNFDFYIDQVNENIHLGNINVEQLELPSISILCGAH